MSVILSQLEVSELVNKLKEAIQEDLKKVIEETKNPQKTENLTIKEFCELYSINRSTIYRWEKAGVIKVNKIGGRVYISDIKKERQTN